MTHIPSFHEGTVFGETVERNRIIKLLEASHNTWSYQHGNGHRDSCASCESLALIKGPEWLDEDIPVPNPRGEN